MQPSTDFGPEIWILVAIVVAILIAIAFAMRKFTVAVTGVEPAPDSAAPLQDHSHTTPFE